MACSGSSAPVIVQWHRQ